MLITLKSGQTIESVAKPDGSFVKQFNYKLAGAIADVTPVQGQGGTTVTISGTTVLGQGSPVVSATAAGSEAKPLQLS